MFTFSRHNFIVALQIMLPVLACETESAQRRLETHIVQSPIIKLKWDGIGEDQREIYLKLENLEAINSFKIRGAVNAILAEKEKNPQMDFGQVTVVTCSTGNMGQAVSYAAKAGGIPSNALKSGC